MTEKDIEFKWAENIAKAKEINTGRNRSQMAIAGLALEVCEITRGGPKTNGAFTLKRFAEESGISSKSLSMWVAARKMVFEKLDKATQASSTYSQCAYVAMRVPYDATPAVVRKKFDELTNLDDMNHKIIRYMGEFRTCANHFVNGAASKCPLETIQELGFFCKTILKEIYKEHKNIDFKENGLAALGHISGLRAADAFAVPENSTTTVHISDIGGRVKITSKDRQIANFIKEKKKFVSPTEIGQKLHGDKVKKPTAWVNGTIQKLVSLDMVERNKFGHYKWKE